MKAQGSANLHRVLSCSASGFTLIEVVVVITILSVLALFAIPSYTGFVERGKLANGTEALVALRGLMEQAYQANRSYQNVDGNCMIAGFTDKYFSHSCTTTSSTDFIWTSTSRAGVGLGSTAGQYVYTVNQDGDAFTLIFKGSELAEYSGWKLRK